LKTKSVQGVLVESQYVSTHFPGDENYSG